MDDSKIKYIGMLFVSTMLAAIAQLSFKYAFDTTGSLIIFLIIGLIGYGLSTLIYFMVLSRSHLSWAYGVGGLSYIFATILAVTILSESVTPLRWIGVIVIFIGVILIGMS
jgi:uncharacterized membrane protein